jgi:hypothetical protein
VQHIVPIVVSLKAALERQHSPLLRGVMLFLREVLRDYRDEAEGIISICILKRGTLMNIFCNAKMCFFTSLLTKDILAADRQLATEIMFDLQQFEQRRLLTSLSHLLIPHLTAT